MSVKKITKSGGITIPKQIRTEAGIHIGSAVDVIQKEDTIIIKKHVPTCHFCNNAEVVKFENMYICENCARKILEKLGAINE